MTKIKYPNVVEVNKTGAAVVVTKVTVTHTKGRVPSIMYRIEINGVVIKNPSWSADAPNDLQELHYGSDIGPFVHSHFQSQFYVQDAAKRRTK